MILLDNMFLINDLHLSSFSCDVSGRDWTTRSTNVKLEPTLEFTYV